MKMKNNKLNTIVEAIGNVGSLELPVSLAFKMSIECKKIKDIYDAYQESRTIIFKKYALKDKKGNFVDESGKLSGARYYINPEKMSLFEREIKELNNIETEMDINKISLKEELGKKIDDIKIKPVDLIELGFLFNI